MAMLEYHMAILTSHTRAGRISYKHIISSHLLLWVYLHIGSLEKFLAALQTPEQAIVIGSLWSFP